MLNYGIITKYAKRREMEKNRRLFPLAMEKTKAYKRKINDIDNQNNRLSFCANKKPPLIAQKRF